MSIKPMRPPELLDEYNLTAVLEAAQDDLLKLTEQRESIDRRINKLQSNIVHLAALCGVEIEDPIKQLGLTDAIRYIFGRAGMPLNRQQVIGKLNESYDVSSYKNLPANVHTIVRRLVKSGEIKPPVQGSVGQVDGQEQYIWSPEKLLPPPPSRIGSARAGKFFLEDIEDVARKLSDLK
jgi:hypothetical protein